MKHLLWISIILLAFAWGCKKDEKTGTAAVTTAVPTNISSNSATSGGNITNNGGSAISKSGVCFASHNNPTLSDSITSDGSVSGTYSSSLTGLNSNTTYYVRAYAINGSGTGYGNTDSFTTAKGVPNISTTAITNNQELTAQSGGNITNDGGAPVTARGICWSTTANPTIANFKTSNGTGIGSFADTLTNLSLGLTYYVRSYAINSYGTGYGNEISFTVSAAGTVTDIDGNVYATVVIGTQTWTTSNLKAIHYLNGDTILNGYSNTNFDWWGNILNSTYIGVYTFPHGDTTQKTPYGLLYNPYAINDSRGICPAGWHVPSDGDWQTLEFYEGMSASDTALATYRGTIGGNLLTGGSSGLNIQLAGEYLIQPGSASAYLGFSDVGLYWSSSIYDPLAREGNYFRVFNGNGPGPIERAADFGYAGSIRCVKN